MPPQIQFQSDTLFLKISKFTKLKHALYKRKTTFKNQHAICQSIALILIRNLSLNFERI